MAENRKTGLMDIFLIFLKIGAFTFGGGYAMIALLEDEFVDKRSWLNESEFLDMTAIAESTPGPVAINAATYLGYKLAGFKGALVASLAVCIPSFAIIYVISFFYERKGSMDGKNIFSKYRKAEHSLQKKNTEDHDDVPCRHC